MSKQNHLILNQLLSSPFLAVEQLDKQLGRTLIMAPHPDDEALGCGGLILHLRSQNIPVWVVFVTSGDASHLNSKDYPPQILASLRENEAKKSCEILGVEPCNIFFLRQPDSLLSYIEYSTKTEIASVILKLLEQFAIASLFLPWRRDPHPDHRITYEIGIKAVGMAGHEIQLVEYPIWLWKKSEKEDWPIKEEVEIFRLNIEEMLPLKKLAIFEHESQTSNLIKDDPEGFILTQDLLSPFLKTFEVYLFSSQKMKVSLGRDYFDKLYSVNPDPWNFRKSDYEKSKYEKIQSFLEDKNYRIGLELGCSIGIQTRYLATNCDHLLAVDVSKDAIVSARELNTDLLNVLFLEMDIIQEFPKDRFNFISLCEIGYYFERDMLISLFEKIAEHLKKNGHFLMVHWTSFVRDYPITGRQVHQLFRDLNKKNHQFRCISSYVHESYELLLWKKLN